MKTYLYFTLLLFAAACSSGCDLINPEEPIPGYIHIPEVSVQANLAAEGSASYNLTEVWVNVNGNFVGAYPIPATIPILDEGDVEIAIQAGIKDNGVSGTPEIYPFYAPYVERSTLGPNSTDTIRPVFEYLDQTKFAFIEDFEGGAQVFEDVRLGEPDQLSISAEDVFEGSGSLKITLDSTSSILEVATNIRYADIVSALTSTVYLEVNYKSDVPVIFGLVSYDANALPGQGETTFDPGFNPSGEWNKIYFNLSAMAVESGKTEHQVILQAFIPVSGQSLTRNQAVVRLDNIKLLHF